MKQILTLTLLVIASLTSNAQKRIESDYSKSFIIDYIWNDYNLNGELDAGEQYKVGDAEATVTLIYKEFGSAGNTIKIKLYIKNGSKEKMFVANCEDVVFLKLEHGYGIYNNEFNECLFSVVNVDGKNHALLFNPAIFEY